MSKRLAVLHLYRARNGDWRWRLKAANGEKIANGLQGYSRRKDALAGFNLTRNADFRCVVGLKDIP